MMGRGSWVRSCACSAEGYDQAAVCGHNGLVGRVQRCRGVELLGDNRAGKAHARRQDRPIIDRRLDRRARRCVEPDRAAFPRRRQCRRLGGQGRQDRLFVHRRTGGQAEGDDLDYIIGIVEAVGLIVRCKEAAADAGRVRQGHGLALPGFR